MNLSFLPKQIVQATANLNLIFLSEIRLRKGQPVVVEYKGKYEYLGNSGICSRGNAIIADDIEGVLAAATDFSVYAYAEQLKNAFITINGGIRIGIAGQYVTENSKIIAVRNPTSLNIRIPHEALNCARGVFEALYKQEIKPTLIFSPPGYGKTTYLRDLARLLSDEKKINVLVFDERNEISAIDAHGDGYNLGEFTDIIRGFEKKKAFENAVRALKPKVIITDELYGEDFTAIEFAKSCNIPVIASSHTQDISVLKSMPFEFFVKLTGIGEPPIIYDKTFNIVGAHNSIDGSGLFPVVGKAQA